jgi:protein TonB
VGRALLLHPLDEGTAPLPGAASPAAPLEPEPMFGGLRPRSRSRLRRAGLIASLGAHAAALALLILVPVLSHEDLPAHRDYIRALLYAPPPPPPPPPPKGTPFTRAESRPRAEPTPAPPQHVPALSLPPDLVATQPRPPESAEHGLEVWGTPEGSEAGVPEGMEGGVVGGTVGGVPGGVLGGVIGGTGDIPVVVKDYDRPPRLIRKVKPVYPPDAFKKKVEGTVLVEIVIGADGRVVQARVLRSVPSLDAAALAAVRQWTFAPAIKNGLAVATSALAPVSFQIY